MFRCQFSGEASLGPQRKWVEEIDEETKHKRRVLKQVAPSESPVTIVVETREQYYAHIRDKEGKILWEGANPLRLPFRDAVQNVPQQFRWEADEDKSFESKGSEIVREIKVRPVYAEIVKKLVESGQPLTFKKEYRK